MRRARKRGFFYYSWKGLSYLLRGVFRGLGLFFVLVVLLAVIGYLGLRSAFDEERVRSVFVDQLQDLLHRPVQIDKVLLGAHGVKLKGLRVVERPDMPGQHLLTSETVLVTVKLSALARGRLEIDQVRLASPAIQLVRDTAGRWSLADLFTSTHAARILPVGSFSLPVSLATEHIRIDQGLLLVEDRLKETRYRFENVSLAAARFSLDQPFAFSLSCDNTSSWRGRAIRSRAAVEGVASLAGSDLARAYVRVKSLALDIDGVRVRASGVVNGLPPGAVETEAALPSLGPEEWKKILGRELELRLPPSRWQLSAAMPEPGRLRVSRLRLDAAPLAATAMGSVDLSSAALKAEVAVADLPLSQAGEMRPAWRKLGLKGLLSGSVGVAGPWKRLGLRKARLRLSRAAGRFKNFSVDGGDVSFAASEGLEDATLTVTGGEGSLFARPFSDLTVAASLKDDDLRLDRLSLRLLDSRIALKARVRDLKDPKEVAVTGSVDRLRWEEAQTLVADVAARVSMRTTPSSPPAKVRTWLRTFKYAIPRNFPDTVGHITIGSVAHKNFAFNNVDLLWDIRGISPSLKQVDGDVRVSFGPGRVGDIPAVQASNKFLRIVFLPFIYMHKMNKLSVFSTATAYPKSLDFSRIEGEYGLKKGVATTRLFYVDSPQMVAFTDGIADFGKETVDMSILTRLASYQGQLPEWWVDELGRPAIAFRVKGDLNAPDLEPRMSKMGAHEIEGALERARAGVKKRYETLEKLKKL
ncbi:MAG: AsmA family protein [Elusimicrobia bacterium]|nr:AsmA family protein [Elusimicrobiota bacterium]